MGLFNLFFFYFGLVITSGARNCSVRDSIVSWEEDDLNQAIPNMGLGSLGVTLGKLLNYTKPQFPHLLTLG